MGREKVENKEAQGEETHDPGPRGVWEWDVKRDDKEVKEDEAA